MAVIEIKAATLPGFPYYFPYRTGVRLTATPTAQVGTAFTAEIDSLGITTAPAATLSQSSSAQGALAVTVEAGADALVTRRAETSLTVTATTPGETTRTQRVSASCGAEVDLTAAGALRPKITAGQDITAGITAGAALSGMMSTSLGVTVTLGSTFSLSARASAVTGVFALTDPEQSRLAATGLSDTTITTTPLGGVSRRQDIDTATALSAITAALANVTTSLAANLAVTAASSGAVLLTQYHDAALEVTSIPAITANNIAAALTVTTVPDASVQHSQVTAAALTVTAAALVDVYGTLYGTALLVVTAASSATLKLDPGYQFYLDLLAGFTADSLRTQYAQDIPTAVIATAVTSSTQIARSSTALGLTAAVAADSLVTRYALADTVVAAITFADISRQTYAQVHLAGFADPSVQAMRTQYVDTTLTTSFTATPSGNLQGLADTDLVLHPGTSGGMQADLIGTADLDTEAGPSGAMTLSAAATALLNLLTEGGGYAVQDASAEADVIVIALLAPEVLRTVYAEAVLNILVQSPDDALMLTQHLDAIITAITAETGGDMLNRKFGGDPMWLPFFHAGYGRHDPTL